MELHAFYTNTNIGNSKLSHLLLSYPSQFNSYRFNCQHRKTYSWYLLCCVLSRPPHTIVIINIPVSAINLSIAAFTSSLVLNPATNILMRRLRLLPYSPRYYADLHLASRNSIYKFKFFLFYYLLYNNYNKKFYYCQI